MLFKKVIKKSNQIDRHLCMIKTIKLMLLQNNKLRRIKLFIQIKCVHYGLLPNHMFKKIGQKNKLIVLTDKPGL